MQASYKNLMTAWLILTAVVTARAMEEGVVKKFELPPKSSLTYDPENVNTLYYNGKRVEITPESVLEIAPKMPARLENDVRGFYLEEKNKELIDQLLDIPHPLSKIFDIKKSNGEVEIGQSTKNKIALTLASLKNKSTHNYVFEIPGTQGEYIYKSAGLFNKLALIYCANNQQLPLDQAEQGAGLPRILETCDGLDEFPTFQNLSRLATYLRVLEWLRYNQGAPITVPNTYAFQTDPSKLPTDKRVFIAEQLLQGQPLANHIGSLTINHFEALKDVMMYAVLWNFVNNLRLDAQNNIILDDLEQQNRTHPLYYGFGTGFAFMNIAKRPDLRDHRQACGIEALAHISAKEQDQALMCAYVIANDPRCVKLASTPGFLHIMDKLKKQYDEVKQHPDTYHQRYAEALKKSQAAKA